MKLAELIAQSDIEVLEHLDREADIPVLSGPQPQGDVFVLPITGTIKGEPVPPEGVVLVSGQHDHRLHAEGDVIFARANTGLTVARVHVPEGATGYLLHTEHGGTGLAPGTYEIRRQREQAEEARLVAD